MALSQAQMVAIDYLSQPDADQITQEEFCAIMTELGYPMVPRTLRRWKGDPEFEAVLEEAKGSSADTDTLFAKRSWRWALIQYMAFHRNAKNPGQARLAALKAITEMTSTYVDATTFELDSVSDETLLRMALARDVTVEGLTRAQMRQMLGGSDGDSQPCARSVPTGDRDMGGVDASGEKRGGA